MKTSQAIAYHFTAEVFEALRRSLSKPELLKAACLRAFVEPPICDKDREVEDTLRKALTHLQETGMFVE